MGEVKSEKINYAIPGDAMSQKEFEEMIKKAEDGPFHTIQKVKLNWQNGKPNTRSSS